LIRSNLFGSRHHRRHGAGIWVHGADARPGFAGLSRRGLSKRACLL